MKKQKNYTYTVGRRKSSSARVRLFKGEGDINVTVMDIRTNYLRRNITQKMQERIKEIVTKATNGEEKPTIILNNAKYEVKFNISGNKKAKSTAKAIAKVLSGMHNVSRYREEYDDLDTFKFIFG